MGILAYHPAYSKTYIIPGQEYGLMAQIIENARQCKGMLFLFIDLAIN